MKKNKKVRIVVIAFIVTILVISVIRGVTYAWFRGTNVFDYYLKSKGFYFSSDELSDESIKNINNSWNGDKVYFTIRNNLNQSVITAYDISYNATCSIKDDNALVSCKMNGSGSSSQTGVLSSVQICQNHTDDGVDVSEYTKIECEQGGYDYVDIVAEKQLYFEVIGEDGYELDDVTVKVTVNTTSPYAKTIEGEFYLHRSNIKANEIGLSYTNFSNYGRLVVSNSYSDLKYLKLSWNSSNIRIDNDNYISSLSDGEGYINQICFGVNGNSNESFRFYTDAIYDKEQFTFLEVNSCD